MKQIFYALAAASLLFSSLKAEGKKTASMEDVIYVQTNDFHGNQNAVIAYRYTGHGKLTQIPGSPFMTGGSGIGNPMQLLGPSDSDGELWMTGDKKYLLAVNSGSNNITVFRIAANGSLSPVPGSPFASGGKTPVSIYADGSTVYAINKSQNPMSPGGVKPNYFTMKMNAAGQLSPMSGGKFETGMDVSPAQALLSNDKKFLFGADFLGFMAKPPVGTLRSFTLDNGKLTPVEGSPYTIPEKGGALGLCQHPTANVLYVGFPLAGKVGVYNIDAASGALSFLTAVEAGPAACWIRTNKTGSRLYVLNSGENAISAYNIENPTTPVSIGKLMLKKAGPKYDVMGMPFVTSEDFSFQLSSDEACMYVLCQHTNKDFSIGNYNYMHVVSIAGDGTLSEPSDAMQMPVDNKLRPKGLIVNNIK